MSMHAQTVSHLRVALQDALRQTFEAEIPLTQAIQIDVERYDGLELCLRAPLAPNINHKATAFAGSLNALLTLSGWGLLWLLLRERELRGIIVIQESTTRYLHPVTADFIARCRQPDALDLTRLETMIQRRGKARVDLAAEIRDASQQVAVAFTGRYVIHREAPDGPAGGAPLPPAGL